MNRPKLLDEGDSCIHELFYVYRGEKKRKLQDHLDPIHQMKSYLDKKNGKEGNEKVKIHVRICSVALLMRGCTVTLIIVSPLPEGGILFYFLNNSS